MLPSDADIAQIVQNFYSDQPPGYWTRIFPDDCGMAALYRWNNHYDVVVWRGSTTLDDWLADLNAVPTNDPTLGRVHTGFLKAVTDLKRDILAAVARPMIIAGHSLGAGHALLFAGFMAAAKEDVQRVVTFGSPCPGDKKLADLLADVPGRDYRNRADPVCDLPPWLYHPRPLTQLDIEPDLTDSFGPLADHHLRYYLMGVEAMR